MPEGDELLSRILLLHVAKTGGTSLRRIFRSHPSTNSFDCVHHRSLIRFRDGERVSRSLLDVGCLSHYDFAILMVRHPWSRLISCYHYFLSGGLNRRGGGDFPADRKAQAYLHQCAPTFADCCRLLPEISERIPHFYPASRWLDVLPNPLADLVFTGRQERFASDVGHFYRLLGAESPPLSQEHFNAGPAAGPELGLVSDSDSRRLVEQYYESDYLRFGYPFASL